MACSTAGCPATPGERLEQGWKAAEDDNTEVFIGLFTAQSASLLRGLREVKQRTKGDLKYLDTDLFGLLPRGDIESVKERGNLTLVAVRAKRNLYEVRLVREEGQWFIDGSSLARFWRPLQGSGDAP